MKKIIGIIPARLASTRFPNKPLELLAGSPIIKHVYFAAKSAKSLSDVFVATDSELIADTVNNFGGKAIMTNSNHKSGSDRIVEAINYINGDTPDIIVNIQGDEPLIRPSDIDKCANAILKNNSADWATLIYKVDDVEANNPNIVKVVCDVSSFALYFSRANIPYNRDNSSTQRYAHIGLYAYKTKALKRFAKIKPTPLEQSEKLEQLRALESGMKIICVETEKTYPGIVTPADLENVKNIIDKKPELLNLK